MTREEARKAAEVMMAYAKEKEIEYSLKNNDCWEVCRYPLFDWDNYKYRIKQKTTLEYRPFKNAEECWTEMQKHQPFGWLKFKNESLICITSVFDDMNFIDINEKYTFADGTPFGIKEK